MKAGIPAKAWKRTSLIYFKMGVCMKFVNILSIHAITSINTMSSFKLQISLSFVMSYYVIMKISTAWTIDKLKIA